MPPNQLRHSPPRDVAAAMTAATCRTCRSSQLRSSASLMRGIGDRPRPRRSATPAARRRDCHCSAMRSAASASSSAWSFTSPSRISTLGVAPRHGRDLGAAVFRVVLHAPEGRAFLSLISAACSPMSLCASGVESAGSALDGVDVHGAGLEHFGLALEHRRDRGPGCVSVMRRAKPNSRPRGLRTTLPPAAVTPTCSPQQLPKHGTPAANTALARSICRSTDGLARIDIERRAGDHRAVVILERHTRG